MEQIIGFFYENIDGKEKYAIDEFNKWRKKYKTINIVRIDYLLDTNKQGEQKIIIVVVYTE